MMRLSTTIVLATLPSAAVHVSAQATDPAATHAGALTTRPDAQLGLVVPSAVQRRAAFAAADAIMAVLRRDDALAKPVGYSVTLTRVAGVTQALPGDAPVDGSLHYGITGALNYFATEDDGHGGHTVSPDGGSVPFSIVVNAPGRLTDAEQLAVALDHGPSVLSDLRETGKFRGHAIYNGECVVVTGPPAPALVPLTMERYYQLSILGARADSARHASEQKGAATRAAANASDSLVRHLVRQAQVDAGTRIHILQSTLRGLSPAERAAPVAISMHGASWEAHGDDLAPIDDPDSSPLVQLNPAFFDRTRVATAPQIITVCIPGLQGRENTAYDRLTGSEREQERSMLERRTRDAVRIRDHLDWPALEALVKP